MKSRLIIILYSGLFLLAQPSSLRAEDSQAAFHKTYYENGRVMSTEPASGEGFRVTYYRTGQKETKVRLVEGRREGQFFGYYPSGSLKAQGSYVNDRKEGVFKRFFESGALMFETEYKDGKMAGPLKGYDENGKRISVIDPSAVEEEASALNLPAAPDLASSGEGNESYEYTKEYYQDGTLKAEKFYKNNLLEGVIKEYYKNGKIKYQDIYQKGNLIQRREYDEQGNLLSQAKNSH